MNRACLCIHLSAEDGHLAELSFDVPSLQGKTHVTNSKERALAYIEDEQLVALIIFAHTWTPEIDSILNHFQQRITFDPENIFVVSIEEDPTVMKGCFEYGIDQLFSQENWKESIPSILENELIAHLEADPLQEKIHSVGNALHSADQALLTSLSEDLKEAAKYNYVAALARGKCLEATGSYEDAEDSFKSGEKLNRTFVPAVQGLCETLILLGKADEAIPRLEKLEKMNKNSFNRKVLLAQAHIKTGDLQTAKSYLDQAASIAPNDPKLKEAEVAYLIGENQIGAAMKVLDETNNIGHFLASRLNEIGVKFSQSGKSDKALTVYKKAHRAVRKELKHKISLNAGIACYRAKQYENAMKYLKRSKAEYGSAYPKLLRVANSVKKAQAGGGPKS
ncbi:MAG: tetratricopeptide repeat protein [Zetaproteobacteria bacterium]|nr:tetratricopeptide repeat protein [Zetaproteobacteria bacterium]